LGHIFTPQLGWRLVAGALVAIGLYFGVQKLLEPRAGIYRVETTIKDLTVSMGIQSYTFNLIPPAEARSIRTYTDSPEISPYSVYGQPIQNQHFRKTIQLHNNHKCEKGKTAAVSITEQSFSPPKFFSVPFLGGIFAGFAGSEGTAYGKPRCVLPIQASRYGISHSTFKQPNAFMVDRWYPLFQVQSAEPNAIRPKYTYTHYVLFSNKDGFQPISPPKISDMTTSIHQSIPAHNESYWEHAKIPIIKRANSVLIVGSAQQLRYSGYAIDLTTRNNLKQFDIRLDHSYYNGGTSCLGTSWRIRFGFNPGERNIDLCEHVLQNIPQEFPKDNLVFGEFVSKLTRPPTYKLDTWIPVYVVPNYVSGRIQNPKPHQSTSSWYILQVKFSSKRVQDGVIPFPTDLPKYRLRHPHNYYSLEAIK
jgi:hypothetical protein